MSVCPDTTPVAFRPDGAKLKLGNCWAHARRGFHRAQDESALAKAVLKDIQDLYRVEAELREGGAGAQQREARRRAESAPMLAALKGKLEAQRPHHLPQSLTGKAVSYVLDRWDGLTMYVGKPTLKPWTTANECRHLFQHRHSNQRTTAQIRR